MTPRLLPSLILVSFFSFNLWAAEPSSEIPTKREFPVDEKVNPCEDFHAYVCSKVESSFKLRDDRSYHQFSFSDSRERILEFRKKFMKELPEKKKIDARTAQIRDFYQACMNEKMSAEDERSEVAGLLKKMKGISSTKALVDFSNRQAPTALSSFVYMDSTPNVDDPKKLDVVAGTSFMLLPDHKYYENAALMTDYQKLIELFFKSILPKLNAEEVKSRAENLIHLQQDFIKTYPVASTRRKRWSERHVQSQSDLASKEPALQLKTLFKKVPASTLVDTPIIEGLDFLNASLEKYPLETWKDLYLFMNLDNILDDAYPDYFKTAFEFQRKYFGGPEKRPDRPERCTNLASSHFVKELDAAMVDDMFPHFDESKVQDVASHIRASIIDGLSKNSWLSPEGKAAAIAKIRDARLQLVKPHNDKEWDFHLIRKYSKKYPIRNLHTFRDARWEKMLAELPKPTNQDAWGMGPLTVNAYYSENENKFVVPIGILQYPFFSAENNLQENLGAIGSVMGHELGHSIDDNGSKYDSQGKLNPWMPPKDSAEFDRRSQRLVQQFDQSGHDGKLTLGENTADLVGLTFAYDAAFPGDKGSVDDKKKFFTSYARLWCLVIRPEFDALRRKTDPHAMGWFRINEQVKQQPGFAEAFACKSKDKMVLPDKDRVKIW